MEFSALLAELKPLARKAGALERRYFEQGTETMRKGDGSPVTAADREAEAIILAGLKHLTPDIPVIAEEEVAAGRIPDISGGTFWLVDPLDGTKEFVNGSGEFTVNIALLKNNRPVLGVIYCPMTDELYTGAGPGTATLSEGGGPDQPIQTRQPPDEGIVVVASRSHANNSAVKERLKDYVVQDFLSRGSSLKFCMLARGQADLYPRLRPTSEWDTAAGEAVLEAAGGHVLRLDGKPLAYGKADERFLNPHFIAYATS